MSLTSMLDDKGSPLSRFLAISLPGVAAVRAECRGRLPADAVVVRPSPPPGVRPAWGTLGAAIDHRLRLALSDRQPMRGAVRAGVEVAAASSGGRALRGAGGALLREAEVLVRRLRPFEATMVSAASDEERLARVCVVAAWFEEIYRTRRVFPGSALATAGPSVTLDDLLAAVPAYAVADVVAMLDLAEGFMARVRAACAPADVVAGPVFAGSHDVGGADADLVAGGLLVDVKATASPRKLPAEDVWQLVCYLLLDYDDRYGIERVGFYYARIGVLVAWDVTAFLGLMGSDRPVATLRRELAAVLVGAG